MDTLLIPTPILALSVPSTTVCPAIITPPTAPIASGDPDFGPQPIMPTLLVRLVILAASTVTVTERFAVSACPDTTSLTEFVK